MLPKSSNVATTLILLVTVTKNLQQVILALPNLGAARLCFMQPVPSSGPPSYTHKSHFFTTEAEYLAMSMVLSNIIPLRELIKEMRERKFDIANMQPYVYCKVFKDNLGTLELARLLRLHLCTKHINVCYHHFCEHVRKGLIKIFPVDTKDQVAIILTNALAQNDFICHQKHICGQ